ncbi:MAG: hypothetical protein ACI92I_000712 [Acidimicrobiales bacterium]|jgi:hypothetical protein
MKRFLFFLVILLVALPTGLSIQYNFPAVSVGAFSEFLPEVEEEIKDIKPSSITFVGDVMLARRVEYFLDKYGSDYVYGSLPEVSTSTVLVGNFESSVPEIHEPTPDLTFSFASKEEHLAGLSEYGFSYMSLANNHSYDKGIGGFLYTQKSLENNDLIPFGEAKGIGTTTIAYVELEGLTVALVGLHTLESLPSDTQLQNVMLQAQAQSDIQIAYVHWGTEYELKHSSSQERFAHKLVDLGVDAVIGHHPHVAQDVEVYKDAPIFYSLGNFIFDQYFSKDVQNGLWVELSFANQSVQYELRGVTSIGSRSTPRHMSKHEEDIFLTSMAGRSDATSSQQIMQGVIAQ